MLFNDIPYLDVTASFNESAKELVVNEINKHETSVIATDILLQSGDYAGNAKVNEVNGETVNSTNTKTKEDVKIVTKDIKFKGNTIRYTFPAHSITQLQIAVK